VSNLPEYKLTLFITGGSPNSVRAINNLKSICELHLAGRYELTLIDVYRNPEIATREQIIALPTLIKSAPGPVRRLVGDMSDTQKVLRGLGISMEK
jgi:circadian clock protein KaiB